VSAVGEIHDHVAAGIAGPWTGRFRWSVR